MKRFLQGLVLAGIATAATADPPFDLWKAEDMKKQAAGLPAKFDAFKSASITLAERGNGSQVYLLAHREGNGQAEWHEHMTDIMVIISGECQLKYGGTVVNGKTTAPGEIRGDSISGGQTIALKAGDAFRIQAKAPHQMFVKKELTYFVAKVKE